MPSVLSHNLKAGATWGSGGEAYDIISDSIADGIDHVVNRVWPKPGGNAFSTSPPEPAGLPGASRRAVNMTGIDIGEGVIEAGEATCARYCVPGRRRRGIGIR